jgi:hypothetical protein
VAAVLTQAGVLLVVQQQSLSSARKEFLPTAGAVVTVTLRPSR